MTEPLVILHSEWSTGWGGQEIRVYSEVSWLRRRGHVAGLVVPPGSALGARAERADIPVAWIPMPRALDPRAVARIASRLRRERAQVLVTHSSVDAWAGGLAARLVGVPVVRMRHLSVPVQRNPFSRVVYVGLCDKIVTTGEAIRTLLVERLKVPPAKVVSVPTGVDLEEFDPSRSDRERVRAELGMGSHTPLLGMIGVLRSWKGHLVFLQALRRVSEKLPDVQAVLVGDGPFRSVIQEAITCHGLEARAHLLGHREDVVGILGGLDMVVSASTAAEGIPQALLQSLAMRRLVVASDVGGIPEVIHPGETGWLVRPGDPDALGEAIVEALADRAGAERMGKRGREMVEASYSLQRMGERMEEVYRALVSGHLPAHSDGPADREP